MTSPHKAGMKERKKTFDPTRTMREPVRIDGANIYALFAGSTEYAGTILISVAKCNVHLSAPTMTPGRYLKCVCMLYPQSQLESLWALCKSTTSFYRTLTWKHAAL
eukprot:scaffold283129_cov21-Tisochrysis_lutea.AAC.1